MAASAVSKRFPRSAAAAPSLGIAEGPLLNLVDSVKSGLPFSRLTLFAKNSGLSQREIAGVLCIPLRTLARRRADGSLTGLESERLVRLARLFDSAANLFEGDGAAALGWLRRPAKAFGGRAPLEMAETEIGARAVEDLIGRLEHGVFS